MLLIGENIHIISKSVREALVSRDRDFIVNLLKKQDTVDYIDLNIGPAKGELENILPWLVEVVQSNSKQGLSFDTTNFNELKAGFGVCRNVENVFINSTTRDDEKLETLTELAFQNDCKLIALTMSKSTGIPKTADERMGLAFEMYEKFMEKEILSENVFFDPLVLPVSVDQGQALEVLHTIQMIKESFDPPVNTIIGLSNISNGASKEIRPLINRVFAVMAFGAGLDAAIVDGCDKELIRIIRMLECGKPESEKDKLYQNIAQMIGGFSELDDVEYCKKDVEQVQIIKTAEVLLGKTVYSQSFTQI